MQGLSYEVSVLVIRKIIVFLADTSKNSARRSCHCSRFHTPCTSCQIVESGEFNRYTWSGEPFK